MYRLLCLLLVGHYEPPCKHKWKIIKQVGVTYGNSATTTRYYLQCEHCGEITTEEGGE